MSDPAQIVAEATRCMNETAGPASTIAFRNLLALYESTVRREQARQDTLSVLHADMRLTAEAHIQWALTPDASSTEAAASASHADTIRAWMKVLRTAL